MCNQLTVSASLLYFWSRSSNRDSTASFSSRNFCISVSRAHLLSSNLDWKLKVYKLWEILSQRFIETFRIEHCFCIERREWRPRKSVTSQHASWVCGQLTLYVDWLRSFSDVKRAFRWRNSVRYGMSRFILLLSVCTAMRRGLCSLCLVQIAIIDRNQVWMTITWDLFDQNVILDCWRGNSNVNSYFQFRWNNWLNNFRQTSQFLLVYYIWILVVYGFPVKQFITEKAKIKVSRLSFGLKLSPLIFKVLKYKNKSHINLWHR